MKAIFPAEWRTQTRWKRRFYARYMRTLERAGYVLVALVFVAFVAAFNVPVEDLVTADKVPIIPFAQPLAANGPTLVVRAFANDFDTVRRGQPLLEVVAGDAAITAYRDWEAVQTIPDSPEKATLLARYARPATTTLAATADGTFRLDAKVGATLDDKASLGRVVDYNDLRLEASLTGDTVTQARTDAQARVTNVVIDPVAGTLFRGGGGVSGSLLGEGVRQSLEKSLVGRTIALRDDVPLSVKEIKEVQVDSDLRPVPGGDASRAVEFDPPADLRVAAQVVEGMPSATVQVSDLPPTVTGAAAGTVLKTVVDQSVRGTDGTVLSLGLPKETRLIVKLKAGPRIPGHTDVDPPILGTMLARTFDAKLKLVSPPAFLIDAVRAADRAGRAVTARVELRTGTRPIALRLLKKS